MKIPLHKDCIRQGNLCLKRLCLYNSNIDNELECYQRSTNIVCLNFFFYLLLKMRESGLRIFEACEIFLIGITKERNQHSFLPAASER